MEEQLNYQKKLLFYRFYDNLKMDYYKINNIDVLHGQDSINYRHLLIVDYSFTIFDAIAYDALATYKDKRVQELFEKWKNKDYMSTDYEIIIGDGMEIEQELNKKGDVLFMKALDFYESEDLKLYIDSLRQVGKKDIITEFEK